MALEYLNSLFIIKYLMVCCHFKILILTLPCGFYLPLHQMSPRSTLTRLRVLSLFISGPHLIQRGLGHRVVLYPQLLLVAGELAENVGQRSLRARELILQRVVMLLLQDAALERLLDKVLHRFEHNRGAANPDNQRVAIAKPAHKRNLCLMDGQK